MTVRAAEGDAQQRHLASLVPHATPRLINAGFGRVPIDRRANHAIAGRGDLPGKNAIQPTPIMPIANTTAKAAS